MSASFQNPDLLPVGTGASAVSAQVSPAPSFPEKTPAPEVVDTKVEKFYISNIASATFHTTDGTPCTFRSGVFSSTIQHIKDYLDRELARGNNYLRAATEDEVKQLMMARDPVGTIKSQLMAEDSDLRATLEKQILAKLMGVKPEEVQGDVDSFLNGAISVAGEVEGAVSSAVSALKNKLAAMKPAVSPIQAGMVGSNKAPTG